MKTLDITANEITFTDGEQVSTITISYNDVSRENEWVLTDTNQEYTVFTREYRKSLIGVVTAWFSATGVKVSTDLSPIMVEKNWNEQEESASKYELTPTYLPLFVGSGNMCHIGNGVWMTRCKHCTHALTHYGVMQRFATTGPHEVEVHDGIVPGINVGILG